jgi:hypothetical protein
MPRRVWPIPSALDSFRPTPAFGTSVSDFARESDRIAAGREAQVASGLVARVTRLDSVPRLAVSMAELVRLPLDHRAGFIVSLVADAKYDVETLLDLSGMRRDEAFAILRELSAMGVIASE